MAQPPWWPAMWALQRSGRVLWCTSAVLVVVADSLSVPTARLVYLRQRGRIHRCPSHVDPVRVARTAPDTLPSHVPFPCPCSYDDPVRPDFGPRPTAGLPPVTDPAIIAESLDGGIYRWAQQLVPRP